MNVYLSHGLGVKVYRDLGCGRDVILYSIPGAGWWLTISTNRSRPSLGNCEREMIILFRCNDWLLCLIVFQLLSQGFGILSQEIMRGIRR